MENCCCCDGLDMNKSFVEAPKKRYARLIAQHSWKKGSEESAFNRAQNLLVNFFVQNVAKGNKYAVYIIDYKIYFSKINSISIENGLKVNEEIYRFDIGNADYEYNGFKCEENKLCKLDRVTIDFDLYRILFVNGDAFETIKTLVGKQYRDSKTVIESLYNYYVKSPENDFDEIFTKLKTSINKFDEEINSIKEKMNIALFEEFVNSEPVGKYIKVTNSDGDRKFYCKVKEIEYIKQYRYFNIFSDEAFFTYHGEICKEENATCLRLNLLDKFEYVDEEEYFDMFLKNEEKKEETDKNECNIRIIQG